MFTYVIAMIVIRYLYDNLSTRKIDWRSYAGVTNVGSISRTLLQASIHFHSVEVYFRYFNRDRSETESRYFQ